MKKKSKKFWNFSTTVRNPERIVKFTKILQFLEGEEWTETIQIKYQILLIQYREYCPEIKNLTTGQISILKNIEVDMSYEQAEDIFNSKKYTDPAVRGRTSFSPLEKMGFAFIDNEKKVRISQMGKLLLEEKIKLSEAIFRGLTKLQYPNPLNSDCVKENGYDIKPFVAILSFLLKLKTISQKEKFDYNGISKREFGIFAMSLSNANDIDSTVKEFFAFRQELKILNAKEKLLYVEKFEENYLKGYENQEHLKDYVDNVLRYFRLTGYIRVRGNGNYIDLEATREPQIKKIIETIGLNANFFETKEQYRAYIGNYEMGILPWETPEDLMNIVNELTIKMKILFPEMSLVPIECSSDVIELKQKIEEMRVLLSATLNNKDFEQYQADVNKLKTDILANKEPLELERLTTFGLKLLVNKYDVFSNCPMGDDGFPTSHAPGKYPDIEICAKKLLAISEVTMITGRNQSYAEGQPVLRHLTDFSEKYKRDDVFCLFIAPSIHRDTLNAFWLATKYEHEGKSRKIVPITIAQLCRMLEKKESFQIIDFLNQAINVATLANSQEWSNYIDSLI